ncbi:MAG TPA: glycosyltransferase family 39 protein [Solirubrobacteraceae bacterium]|nr:glycosyltransferase family 39 protein [Solirubrobacteraceae bacterium]
MVWATRASASTTPGRRPSPRALGGGARAPLVALLVVSALSLGARAYMLGEPCQSPCTTAGEHTLIFDEAYYVNAARVIAGIRPPAADHYSDAPLGTDPNAEHPQGAKLIMAAAIELFGDGPFAWRIGSLLMGSIAILGMYALVRAAGGGAWQAVGAGALMAADNLLLVHGRIGTLDIYAVAMMVWAVALYLRGRPVWAGVALAVGTCFKELAPYALFALALLELGRAASAARAGDRAPPTWRARAALGRLAATVFVTCGVFVGLLGLMGLIAEPYADAEHRLIAGGPFAEILHIIRYAAALRSPNGPEGIASYPWQWLIDLKPIVYLSVNAPAGHVAGAIRPSVLFLGMVSPPILALGLASLMLFAWRLLRGRCLGRLPAALGDVQMMLLALAWFLGTWTPYALQSLIDQRTSYLYYMVVVMPGLYVGAIHLAALAWRGGKRWRWARPLVGLWWLTVLAAAVVMYPFVAVFL